MGKFKHETFQVSDVQTKTGFVHQHRSVRRRGNVNKSSRYAAIHALLRDVLWQSIDQGFHGLGKVFCVLWFKTHLEKKKTQKSISSHELWSERVSEQENEQMQRIKRTNRAVRSKWVSKRCERRSYERTSEVVQYGLTSRFARRFWIAHSDPKPLEFGMLEMGDSLIRSLVRLRRSFVRLLAHSLAPELVGQWNVLVQFSKCPESLCVLRVTIEPRHNMVLILSIFYFFMFHYDIFDIFSWFL